MSEETTPNTPAPGRLTIGEGTIDPDIRVAQGEMTDAEIDDFANRLATDEFYSEVEPFKIPNKCVDGRPRQDGAAVWGADSAGGTFSVVIGDALTTNQYRRPGEKAAEHAATLYEQLVAEGHKVGVHDDDHAAEPNCGCGAEDKLDNVDASQPSILRYIMRRGGDIRDMLESISISIDTDTHDLIMSNARRLVAEHYASSGVELRQAARAGAGDAAVETLSGGHGELVLGINTKPGTTLNRGQIQATLGDKFQAFNLDIAPLREAATIIASSPKEAEQKFVAMLYYNVATAAVLAGPALRVIVR